MAPCEFRCCATRVAGAGDAADRLPVQLMTAHAAAFPPAWRRLNHLANGRLWPPIGRRGGHRPSKLRASWSDTALGQLQAEHTLRRGHSGAGPRAALDI